MPKSLVKARYIGGAALALSLTLAGCKHDSPPPAPLRTVVAVDVVPATTFRAKLPAVVQARFSTPLSFRVNGILIERHVYIGDTIKRGQPLAKLDPSDADKNVLSAKAAADAARHRLTFAQAQRVRDDEQAKEQLISTAQKEQSDDAYAAALAQYQQAAQQAALAADQLSYRTLSADHDGVITAENAQTGEVVSAGQQVYMLAWSGPRDVVADIAENAIDTLAIGAPAEVRVPALPGRTFAAHVREIAPAADPQSRTFRVKFSLDRDDPLIRLGMTATVQLSSTDNDSNQPHATTTTAPTLTIPATALFHMGEQAAVWVIQPSDHRVALRQVDVGGFGARTVQISRGLHAGEQIVAQGVHAISSGEQVHTVAPIDPSVQTPGASDGE